MANAYYIRIDKLLTYCVEAKMENNGTNWQKGLQSLYCEVYPKMTKDEQEDATEMLNILTAEVKTKKKSVDTSLFMKLELFLRTVLEKKGMLTPKRDTSGL